MALTNSSKRLRHAVITAALLLAAVAAALVALSVGPFEIPLSRVFAPATGQESAILYSIRLPRIAMALLVGGGLALSGATIQAIFRNPIAEPGLLGVSLGAALGAVIAIASGLSIFFELAIPIAASIGALTVISAVYMMSKISLGNPLYTLLMLGVAVSSLASALISLILLAIADVFAQRQILFWLAGGLDTINWGDVRIAVLPIVVGALAMLYLMRDLNLLTVGDGEARALGLNVTRTRWVGILGAALTTGAAVAFTGTIGFIGLVIPHAMRLLIGHDNRLVLPLSVVGGGLFLLVADTLARVIVSPTEIRVGIITAIIGTPIFVFLLLRSKLS